MTKPIPRKKKPINSVAIAVDDVLTVVSFHSVRPDWSAEQLEEFLSGLHYEIGLRLRHLHRAPLQQTADWEIDL